MTCIPMKPCKTRSPSKIQEYLRKARDACYWVGHFNDPPLPTDEFDDWLMAVNSGAPPSNSCCGGSGSGGQTNPFVDVFLYMMLKARQAAAPIAMIMLSTIVIALWSAQFISGRWSRTLKVDCAIPCIHLCLQAAVLFTLNVFVLFTVYWPAYHAFISITGVVVWIVTTLKTAVLSIFVLIL